MSYQETPLKKQFSGQEVCPLSVAKEILELRKDIENKVQHAGANLELVYQAYSEIQKAHGHHPIKFTTSCSGCVLEWNKLICNWFKLYDQGTTVQKAYTGAIKSKPLVPIADKKPVKIAKDLSNKAEAPKIKKEAKDYSIYSYAELLEQFEATATKKEQDEINGGKMPKKAQILAYFNK